VPTFALNGPEAVKVRPCSVTGLVNNTHPEPKHPAADPWKLIIGAADAIPAVRINAAETAPVRKLFKFMLIALRELRTLALAIIDLQESYPAYSLPNGRCGSAKTNQAAIIVGRCGDYSGIYPGVYSGTTAGWPEDGGFPRRRGARGY
jgi:hypothetical protein